MNPFSLQFTIMHQLALVCYMKSNFNTYRLVAVLRLSDSEYSGMAERNLKDGLRVKFMCSTAWQAAVLDFGSVRSDLSDICLYYWISSHSQRGQKNSR